MKKKITNDSEIENILREVEAGSNSPQEGISELTISFPNEDLNKVVEKINELVRKSNGTV